VKKRLTRTGQKPLGPAIGISLQCSTAMLSWRLVKYGMLLAAGAAFVVGAAAVHQWDRRSAAQPGRILPAEGGKAAGEPDRAAARTREVADLNQQLIAARAEAAEAANVRARLRELEQRCAELQQARDPVASSDAARVASGAPEPAESVPAKKLLTGEDKAIAGEAVAKAQMDRRYRPLLDKLKLGPADAERFIGLMVSRRMAADDLSAAAGANGDPLTGSPRDFATAVTASRDDVENDIHALLGDAGYAQFRQYETQSGATNTVARIQRELATSAPLSAEQAQQIQDLMAAGGSGHLTPKVLRDSRSFLSPEQVQALQEIYAQQREAQLQRRMPTQAGTH
jgi:hypothetical protein